MSSDRDEFVREYREVIRQTEPLAFLDDVRDDLERLYRLGFRIPELVESNVDIKEDEALNQGKFLSRLFTFLGISGWIERRVDEEGEERIVVSDREFEGEEGEKEKKGVLVRVLACPFLTNFSRHRLYDRVRVARTRKEVFNAVMEIGEDEWVSKVYVNRTMGFVAVHRLINGLFVLDWVGRIIEACNVLSDAFAKFLPEEVSVYHVDQDLLTLKNDALDLAAYIERYGGDTSTQVIVADVEDVGTVEYVVEEGSHVFEGDVLMRVRKEDESNHVIRMVEDWGKAATVVQVYVKEGDEVREEDPLFALAYLRMRVPDRFWSDYYKCMRALRAVVSKMRLIRDVVRVPSGRPVPWRPGRFFGLAEERRGRPPTPPPEAEEVPSIEDILAEIKSDLLALEQPARERRERRRGEG